ncbi:MAG: hypothetical protein JXB39_15140 [Deltaproteobacteria bacterium]|nr:hypothetical protein [Deltaproteobacteria bacterium]
MTPARVCARCVLPESPPEIGLDDRGTCSVCHAWDREQAEEGVRAFHETDFTRILNQHRGKGPYDCLVMCSGGRDSTAALTYMVRRYRAKVLAFMFDHGFETEEAVANVQRAVRILDVDFLQVRSTYMHGIFRAILETDAPAVICHVCSIWYMDLTFQMADRFGIPLIVAGWTRGQSTHKPILSKGGCDVSAPEFRRMGMATRAFLEQHVRFDPRYRDLPTSMEEVQRRARKRRSALVLSPHWFLPHTGDDYEQTIRREVGWQAPESSYPKGSTNCALNFVSVWHSMRHYGYTHYHVEMSKLIRQGLLTREEALDRLQIDFDPEMLDRIVAPLGVRCRSAR